MELLWLFVPDWEQNGMMATIKSIPKPRNPQIMSLDPQNTDAQENELFWQQNDDCAGFKVSQDCPFRAQEMELVTY